VAYDPIHDFAPISMTATIENVLVVNLSVPAKNIAELVAYAKANPNKLSYSSSGVGSTYHLSGELFASATHTKMLHVPYKGAAPAATDVLAGHISLMFDNIPSALPNIKTGKERALGVASLKRYKDLPDVPTIAESGVPGYEVIIWTALYAPAKTPRPVIDVLNRAVVAALAAPDMQERYAKLGMNPDSSTPDALLAYNRADLAKWGRVVKDANIKLD
jgi:tripartite-type tricarboxylate transporter receptor subunit TctC